MINTRKRQPIKNIKIGGILLVWLISLCFTACKKEELPLASTGLDLKKFAKNLECSFTGNCMGMQYSIVRNNTVKLDGAIGKARFVTNSPETDYTSIHRKSVQSCSKTLTALTLLAVLKDKNLSKLDVLSQFLPSSWNVQAGVQPITFEEMLRHRSALDNVTTIDPILGSLSSDGSYESMKSYVLHGNLRASKNFHYANINYTLFRVAIAYLIDGGTIESMIQSGNEADIPEFVAQTYIQAVRDYILIPAGVDSRADVRVWDDNSSNFSASTCFYNFSNLSIVGYTHPDQTLTGSGAGGWYLNSNEYISVIASFFHNEYPLLDVNEVTTTGEPAGTRLGMYENNYTSGSLSRDYFTHNGAYDDGRGRGARAFWLHIPKEDVQVMVQMNSANNGFTVGEAETLIMQAYDNAFIK